jgi:hypothetical protein
MDGSVVSIIGRNRSTKFGMPPLPGTLPQLLREGGEGTQSRGVMVDSPVAVATGKWSVGPSGLRRAIAINGFEKGRYPPGFHTGGTPVPRCGSRTRLSVYPHHQPQRGGFTSSGAARPRDSKERKSLLSPGAAVATGISMPALRS